MGVPANNPARVPPTSHVHALPRMARVGYGRVINIASVHGLVASANKSPYVAAKFGLVGLSRVAALEYASLGTALIVPQIAERSQSLSMSQGEAALPIDGGWTAQ